MKWNRLLAGAVCASLLSVPVWAVEGGEAPAAGAGQTSSTACRGDAGRSLPGPERGARRALPGERTGDAPTVEGGPGPGMDCDLAAGRERTRIENEDQVMNLTYGLTAMPAPASPPSG